ncbi:MAG: rane protein DedA, SNARE-associated domain, partial [Chloroflexi bacterium]|nr:rane protein DedA, SNARE-associated domain [Chloroflexota bacterium]
PGVRTFISLPAGIARMPLAKFSFYAFVGSFIWSAPLAYGGYVLGQNWEELRTAMRPFDLPILVAVIILILVFVWLRLRTRRNARKIDDSKTGQNP